MNLYIYINLFCNIINAGSKSLTITKDLKLGRLCSVEESNEQFNNDVLHFKKLEVKELVDKVVLKNQYTGYSKTQCPVKNNNDYNLAMNLIDNNIFEQINKIRFGKNLSNEQKQLLNEVLVKNKDAFQWNKDEVGQTNMVEHEVHTTGPGGQEQGPIQVSQYPIHHAAKDGCRQQVKDMHDRGVIRDSNSSWRSPVLLVKKKTPDNKVVYRFCVDLKKVNAITTKDCYSLPIIGDTVDSLNGCKYFSTLDVDQAFWQIPMREEDKKKYAFVFEGRLYEFNRMPFGAMNAPSTFQRLIDRVLRGLTWKQCLVYMDDVLIFSKTFEQHLIDIDEVLNRFKFAGLKLKPTKCVFADSEVEYLGYKLSDKGIHATEKRIETVLLLKPPVTNKQLYSFLCSMTYYRLLAGNKNLLLIRTHLVKLWLACYYSCKMVFISR